MEQALYDMMFLVGCALVITLPLWGIEYLSERRRNGRK